MSGVSSGRIVTRLFRAEPKDQYSGGTDMSGSAAERCRFRRSDDVGPERLGCRATKATSRDKGSWLSGARG